jgi:type I restriction enzyme S subunit
MGKYQAYPKYQESGEEWLGKVPNHWKVIQIKHLSSVKRGASPRPIDDPKYFDEDGEYVWTRIADVTASDVYLTKAPQRLSDLGSSLSVKLEPESLFLSIAGTVGKPCITGMKACIHDGFVYFPELKIPSKFLFYVFAGEQAYKGLGKFGTQLNLNTDTVGGIKIGCTENEELENIVNFLDHETAKIDTLIEKQQQLIALLKEKRQAVISHAVTKGLNANAPMRDSGVEWLGDVPEHWVRIKLKHITKEIIDAEHKTAEYFDDGEYLVCRTTNVRDGQLRLEGGKYTNLDTYTEWTRRGMPEVGDILFTREAPAGEACVYSGETPLCLGQRMVMFKLKTERVEPNFVLHSIYSGLSDDFIKQLSQGSTVAHFNMADIQNIPLFEPPMEEQKQINGYLVRALSKYDGVIQSASDAINLMQERRTALISAAVTGKIDVRNWQVPETNHTSRKGISV